MLALRSVHISRLFCQSLIRSYATAASAPVIKPFHYQQLLEHEKKLDTPYKKLTGIQCVALCLLLSLDVIGGLCFTFSKHTVCNL